MLDIPQLLRQIDIVFVRIFKAQDRVPKRACLLRAIALYLVYRRRGVNALSADKYGHLKLLCREVGEGLALPGEVGVKQLERLFAVDFLVVNRNQVCECLSRLVVKQPPQLLVVGVGYLRDVFANLYLRGDYAVRNLNNVCSD